MTAIDSARSTATNAASSANSLREPKQADLLVIPVGAAGQPTLGGESPDQSLVAAAVARVLVDKTRARGIDVIATAPIAVRQPGAEQQLLEFARAGAARAKRIAFLNVDRRNVTTLTRVVESLRVDAIDAAWLSCLAPGVGGELDRGKTAASLLLHLDPQGVQFPITTSRAAGATVELGESVLQVMGESALRRLRHWAVHSNGSLRYPQ